MREHAADATVPCAGIRTQYLPKLNKLPRVNRMTNFLALRTMNGATRKAYIGVTSTALNSTPQVRPEVRRDDNWKRKSQGEWSMYTSLTTHAASCRTDGHVHTHSRQYTDSMLTTGSHTQRRTQADTKHTQAHTHTHAYT